MNTNIKEINTAERKDIKRFPLLLEYYDIYTGKICIPLDTFVSNSNIQKECFDLLGSKNLIKFDACWAMTRALIGNEDGDLIEGVVIQRAEEWLS